jgi:hypothetical protein
VFDVDAILATALLHHQRVHDNYVAELKADQQTAIGLHREACARDYSREDAAAAVPAVPAKDDDTDAGSDDAMVGSDDIVVVAVRNSGKPGRALRRQTQGAVP